MRRAVRTVGPLLVALFGLSAAVPALARFANLFQPVPLERLFTNIRTYTEKNPKDAAGFYTLGRVHSLAFARDEATAQAKLEPTPSGLPSFPPWESVLQQRDPAKPLSDAGARHLAASVKHYTRSVQLAPREPLYWLGLGWMTEQGVPHAKRIPAPFAEVPAVAPAEIWREKAQSAYRKAYELSIDADLKNGSNGPGADSNISLEAAEGLIRLLDRPAATAADRAEVANLKITVKRLESLPRVVTPIIFPLDAATTLAELLDSSRTVGFDLAGDTRAESWPWIRSNAGILVWDPRATGRITSGTQLFGTRTWSMYWQDGYAALASLDDNGDGRLAGNELKGIAVWRDGNQNGVSDLGEVEPVTRHAISQIAVTSNGSHAGIPWNPRGVRLQNGTWRPTFDWTPTSRYSRPVR